MIVQIELNVRPYRKNRRLLFYLEQNKNVDFLIKCYFRFISI
jgi:hypothetical protein